MGAMASQITSLTIVYSTVYSNTDQGKHQSSASLAFVWGIVTGEFPAQMTSNAKMFPLDDVIIIQKKKFQIRWNLTWNRCILHEPQVSIHNHGVVDRLSPPPINHDDVIKWKHFPRNWPFVRGIHRSRWIPHTQASGAELWCFLWSVSDDWVNNREAGDLRRHRGHYDDNVIEYFKVKTPQVVSQSSRYWYGSTVYTDWFLMSQISLWRNSASCFQSTYNSCIAHGYYAGNDDWNPGRETSNWNHEQQRIWHSIYLLTVTHCSLGYVAITLKVSFPTHYTK